MHFKVSLTVAMALGLTVPAQAIADVTADDVWNNSLAYVSALGGTLTATLDKTGSGLKASGIVADFALPMGAGSLRLVSPDTVLRERGDGRVEVLYAEPAVYTFSADITGEGMFSAELILGMSNITTVASGDPGDVTYTYTGDEMSIALGEWSAPAGMELDGVSAALEGTIQAVSGTLRVQEGDLVRMSSDASLGEQVVTFRMTRPDGGATLSKTVIASQKGNGVFSIPANGAELMNLAAAIQDGMAYSVEASTTGYTVTQTETLPNGQEIVAGNGYAASAITGSLGPDGIRIAGSGDAFYMDIDTGGALPIPISVKGDRVTMDMAMPLAKGSGGQPYKMAMSIVGITMTDDLWSLFDPTGALPRDPAAFEMDVTGELSNAVDLLDVNSVTQAAQSSVPVQVQSADVNALRLKAGGAELTGSGSVTFDNDDLASYGGMPKPVGSLEFILTGANTLLDTLVAMGLVRDQDAMGARMGMGMVTKPDPAAGEDVLRSEITFTEDGGLLANGVQLK
jgi:hypothetical protein